MGLGEASWHDSNENYADGWTKFVSASTAENVVGVLIGGTDYKQPVVVYSITVAASQAVASGEVVLVDGSATGDSGDTRRFRCVIASAATTDRQGPAHFDFPRGIRFDTGLIVSAATLTAAISLTYKPRY
jgi:hypothetical protein